MPPVPDPQNLYSETAAGKLRPRSPATLERIYVPNLRSNDVYVVDPAQMKVVDRFKVGLGPQHIVPSWDVRTLWVTNNAEGRDDGSLTPIDPRTGKPGQTVPVDDPYNLYYTPDGKSAIVVAEARKRLDFRDPKTMQLHIHRRAGLPRHQPCRLLDRRPLRHLHLRISGTLAKIDLAERKVLGYLQLRMPSTRFKEMRGAACQGGAGVGAGRDRSSAR